MTKESAGQTVVFAGSYNSVPAEASADAVVLTRPTVFARRAAPPDWLADTIVKLDKLVGLEQNWDSYGASPVDHTSVATAKELIRYLAMFTNVDKPAVGATPDGQVGFSWDEGAWSLDVEVLSDGRFAYVYLDERDGSNDRETATRESSELLPLLTQWS